MTAKDIREYIKIIEDSSEKANYKELEEKFSEMFLDWFLTWDYSTNIDDEDGTGDEALIRHLLSDGYTLDPRNEKSIKDIAKRIFRDIAKTFERISELNLNDEDILEKLADSIARDLRVHGSLNDDWGDYDEELVDFLEHGLKDVYFDKSFSHDTDNKVIYFE